MINKEEIHTSICARQQRAAPMPPSGPLNAAADENVASSWGAISFCAAGFGMLVPLVFYFFLLPAAGSGAEHAQSPSLFLPWVVESGQVRVALWWAIVIPFTIALFGCPFELKRRLEFYAPSIGEISALAGILGFFIIIVASLMLLAGEPTLARAYMGAGEEARQAIVATYEWQRLVTAFLFDALGLFMLGLWIFLGSIAGLRYKALPKRVSQFGIFTALCTLSCALGYVTKIRWLGEFGIGQLSFIALPAWMIWFGLILWRESRNKAPLPWAAR